MNQKFSLNLISYLKTFSFNFFTINGLDFDLKFFLKNLDISLLFLLEIHNKTHQTNEKISKMKSSFKSTFAQ